MKQIKKIGLILSLMALILFSGCSNNESKDNYDSELDIQLAVMKATQPQGKLIEVETEYILINNINETKGCLDVQAIEVHNLDGSHKEYVIKCLRIISEE